MGGGQAIAAASFCYPDPCKSVTITALQIRDHATVSSPLRDRNRLQFTLTEFQTGVHYVRDHREGAPMPATLKLFKKAPETASQADAATLPKTNPVVVETTAPPARLDERSDVQRERIATEAQRHQKVRQSLQDNSRETDRFVRSNN
jgi:hypothetical protein